eukprot:2896804-Prorocentrum_lima.AAC.1
MSPHLGYLARGLNNLVIPHKDYANTWKQLKEFTPVAIPSGEPRARSIHFIDWIREIQLAARL